MAHVSKVPVSRVIAEAAEEDGGTSTVRSRGDYKKERELEEMRKAGTAPAAVDAEGKDINPHIPQYISDAPWYLDPKGPTLDHQRQPDEQIKIFSGIDEWYPKGPIAQQAAFKVPTKYRKGACDNCGALTHKKKDCLERPRKVGAKFSGSNLAPDEQKLPELALTFDGKRDRWNGYDNFAHTEVIEEHRKLDEVKKEVRRDRLKAGLGNPEEDDGAPSSDEDEDKYVEKMDMPGTKVDAAERYTVRNLRIREDTAKYLRNLDPNSAHYDPKTRSMRKNPYETSGLKDDEVEYSGDNFVRVSGDTIEHAKSQMFSWEAAGKGLDVHALAEPTKLEALKRVYVEKKNDFKDVSKSKIFDKYGGEEHLLAPPRELIFAQSEDYVEYSRSGKVIKGQESTTAKSRYTEDVYPNNHTSVWGSFWFEGKWGFKCCHSLLLNSYCTGDAGKSAVSVTSSTASEAFSKSSQVVVPPSEEAATSNLEDPGDDEETSGSSSSKKKSKKAKKRKKEMDFEEEVKNAMRKQHEEEAEAEKTMDERKRSYNSTYEVKAPSEAEVEAYYRKRQREEDPMKQFQ